MRLQPVFQTLSALVIVGMFGVSPGLAQTPANCTLTSLQDPDRQVYQCAGDFIIEVEAAAQIGFVVPADGSEGSIQVDSGAVLIEVEKRENATQIRTPHAIAAVRGTVYAVDVTDGSTAVFVLHGQVAVSDLEHIQNEVLLGAGEGVDVIPGDPLQVVTWGAERAQRLLARFGR